MRTPFQGAGGWRLVVGALIVYGSLYPFRFEWPDSLAAALHALVADSRLWSGRGDVAGNLLLFLPWGALQPSGANRARWDGPTFASGLALALALQLLQIGLPGRDAALSDVFWNGAGILAGQLALAPVVRAFLHDEAGPRRLGPDVILPLLWLTVMALPLLPSLDWHALKSHLRIFLAPSPIGVPELALAYGSVLVVACALRSGFPPGRSLLLLALVIGLAAAAKLLTLHNALYRAEVLAWGLAWASSVILLKTRPQALPTLAFAVMLLGLSLAALEPFTFSGTARTFNLLPFVGYLRGDMLGNLRELALTAWVAVAILWVGGRMGGNVAGIGVFLVAWVLLLELAQMWIRGRSADITPVLTTLLVTLAMRGMRPHASAAAPQRAPSPARRPHTGTPPQRVALRFSRPLALGGLAAWGAAVLALSWLIRQPGVPYNVRELFIADGHPLAVAIFSLALLWLGAGGWLAVSLAARARHFWLALPGALMLSALVSLLLLALSVTRESLMDIAGSSNLHWMVVNRLSWGQWWAEVFRDALGPQFVAPVERLVRYVALYLPPTAFLAVALVSTKAAAPHVRGSDALKAVAVLVPVLWLCKKIAFDWSSTDNLNELIAQTGAFGLGGGAYLYLLLAVVAFNMAVLGQASRPRTLVIAAAVTALCLPASWYLLVHGLSPAVEKYGLIYSGVQFLLGADRSATLPEHVLQLRWAALYLGLQAVGAAGVQLARHAFRRAGTAEAMAASR